MRCYHCGAVLQSKNKHESGYIEKELLEAENAEQLVLYCRTCHDKMSIINAGMLGQDVDDEILKVLDDAVATDALILWVVDLFNFNGTLNPDVVKKLKNNKVTVIGTKRDLFPKKFEDKDLKEYLKERFNEVGINPYGIFLFGNEDSVVDDEYIKALNKAREGHDVYLIGSTASGKTSLINRMLKFFTNTSKRVIKTIQYPGTSLQMLEIPFSKSAFCYEVPGFSLRNSVLGKVEKDIAKFITPKKEIRIHARNLSEDESIVVGSLAAFSLVKGKPTQFRLYCAEGVEYKKIATKNLEKTLSENYVKKTIRPVSERFSTFKDYDLFEYAMENDGKVHDIAVSGLCWVSFVARGQTIRVLLPKGVAVKECLGKIK